MKFGFLGYGNLARAIVRGILNEGLMAHEDICVFAKTEATLSFAGAHGLVPCRSAEELFALCDTVFIAVKPKVFFEISSSLSDIDTSGKRVVSLMAAVSITSIKKVFSCPVMRVMPSLASADAVDVIGYSYDNRTARDFDGVMDILARLGDAVRLDEDMLDRLTVASSCGLGFAAHILEVYKNQCMDYGFSPEQSEMITRRMFSYAADGGRESGQSFAELESRVATRGGATEAGNLAMDKPLREAVSAAFGAAGERAIPKKK